MKKHYFKEANFSTLKEMLYNVSEKFGDKPAFILKDNIGDITTVSYFNFLKDVESIGISLINHGYLNKRIALIGRNSYKWAVSYFAASIVGIVVPIDRSLHSDDVVKILNASDASVIIGDNDNLYNVFNSNSKLYSAIDYINFDAKTNADCFYGFDTFKSSGLYNLDNDNKFKNLKVEPDKISLLTFPTNSVKKSSSIYFSQENICNDILSTENILKIDDSSSVLEVLPNHQYYECILLFLIAVFSGSRISLCSDFKKIVNSFLEFKPNIIYCNSLLIETLHDQILSELKSTMNSKYFSDDKHVLDKVPFWAKFGIKRKVRKSFGGKLKKIIVCSTVEKHFIDSFSKFGITILADSESKDVEKSEEKNDNEEKDSIIENTDVTDLVIFKKRKFIVGFFYDVFANIIKKLKSTSRNHKK